MILVIDTSSARSALAMIDPNGEVVREEIDASGPAFDLPARYREVAGGHTITGVAVAEAGRGRVYHLAPGQDPGLGEPVDLPRDWPVVGWLQPKTRGAIEAAGLRMKVEEELKSFGAAAAKLLESAHEVAYGSLKLEYMQSFSASNL
jgi:hypothetical protein